MKTIVLTLLSVVSVITLHAQNLTDDLILYYPFNGDALDYSGNGYHGIWNGPTPTTDHLGNPTGAYFFDGVNDVVNFPNIPQVKPQFPITIAFWVKVNSFSQLNNPFFATDHVYNNYHGFWAGLSGSGQGNVAVSFGGGLGSASPNNRRGKVSSGSLTIGNWHHIIIVLRGANDMDIYIDCVDAGGSYTGSGSTNMAYSFVPGKIASLPANSLTSQTFFNGAMEDFAMWERELTIGVFSEFQQVCDDSLMPLAINRIANSDNIVQGVYPNPITTGGVIQVANPDHEQLTCVVYNALGQEVQRLTTTTHQFKIDNNKWESGAYFFAINKGTLRKGSGKFVVTER